MLPKYLLFREDVLDQRMPLSLMMSLAEAAEARAPQHALNPEDIEVAFHWSPKQGEGFLTCVHYGPEGPIDIVKQAMPCLPSESPWVWLRANSIVHVEPKEGPRLSIALLANGLIRHPEAQQAPSLAPLPVPADALPGAAAAHRWCVEGEVGMSSAFMCERLYGINPYGNDTPHASPYAPQDEDDTRRCRGFLNAVPEARARVQELASASEEWAQVIAEWTGSGGFLQEEATVSEPEAKTTRPRSPTR